MMRDFMEWAEARNLYLGHVRFTDDDLKDNRRRWSVLARAYWALQEQGHRGSRNKMVPVRLS